jgi:hypothetical protein
MEQLMIYAKAEIGLSGAIVDQESGDVRCAFDAEA